MDIERYREYCIGKAGVTEDFPFDEETLVFRIGGKIFALLDLTGATVNLKCDPENAVKLREQYAAVRPGYHMNKAHWNTIPLNQVSDHLIREWTDHSYDLVFHKLPGKVKAGLIFS